jgi:hypothetical protein
VQYEAARVLELEKPTAVLSVRESGKVDNSCLKERHKRAREDEEENLDHAKP